MKISHYLRKFDGGYAHWCPGCEELHWIGVEKPLASGAQWTFNGDVHCPTFSPSVRIRIDKAWGGNTKAVKCCHYFLKSGRLEFCSDSTHALSGQTVDLPVLPVGWDD